MASELFSLPRVAEVAGLSFDVVNRWAKAGVIVPSVPAGRYRERRFDRKAAYAVFVMGLIRRAGVSSRDTFKKVFRFTTKADLAARWSRGEVLLLCNDQTVILARGGAVVAGERGRPVAAVQVHLPSAWAEFARLLAGGSDAAPAAEAAEAAEAEASGKAEEVTR